LDQLRLDGGTQPRAALSFETIDDYSELMANGAKFPAISVCYDGQLYWVVDGFHRIKAAWQAGLESIDAEVWQGTLQDAQWESYAVNHRHGLRRTNEDKQRAVKAALVHPSGGGLSNRQLARHCGVTHPLVAAWREKLELSGKVYQIGRARTVTRAGTTYQQDTANIGRSASEAPQTPASPEAPQPDVPPAAAREAKQDDGAPVSPAPVRTTRSQRIDRVARLTLSFIEATKHLAHLVGWLGETAGEFDAAELLLSNAINAIVAASAEIERKALAADPLNATRLEIQEKTS
jgi:transposase-like protein